MIQLAALLTSLAAISWQTDFMPGTARGLYFGEGVSAGLTASAVLAWTFAIASSLLG
jgi:hypothetical protein